MEDNLSELLRRLQPKIEQGSEGAEDLEARETEVSKVPQIEAQVLDGSSLSVFSPKDVFLEDEEDDDLLVPKIYVAGFTLGHEALSSPVVPDTEIQPAPTSKKTLGRYTSEALLVLLPRKLSPSWHSWEQAFLLTRLHEVGFDVDAQGWARVQALRTLKRMGSVSTFHTNWKACFFLTCNLMGRPVKWREESYPTLVELYVVLNLVVKVLPRGYSHAVQMAMAALCISEGILCPTGILSMLSDEILLLLRSQGSSISEQELASVHSKIIEALTTGQEPDPDAEPDIDKAILLAQVVRSVDLHRRAQAAMDYGQAQVDAILETGDVP